MPGGACPASLSVLGHERGPHCDSSPAHARHQGDSREGRVFNWKRILPMARCTVVGVCWLVTRCTPHNQPPTQTRHVSISAEGCAHQGLGRRGELPIPEPSLHGPRGRGPWCSGSPPCSGASVMLPAVAPAAEVSELVVRGHPGVNPVFTLRYPQILLRSCRTVSPKPVLVLAVSALVAVCGGIAWWPGGRPVPVSAEMSVRRSAHPSLAL